MSFNNASFVQPGQKRNLRRANRLQNNGNFTPFDNPGFVEDKDNNIPKSNDDMTVPSVIQPRSKEERRKKYDESKTKPHARRLPETTKPPRSGSTSPKDDSQLGIENVELQVKVDNVSQQDEKKVLLESVNVLQIPEENKSRESTKKPYDPRKDNQETTSSVSTNDKASKELLMSNLKKFEAATATANSGIWDRLRMARPSFAADIRFDEDFVDGENFARSRSMREGKAKSRGRLLRDISFSDTVYAATKNYGALKNMNLPRRQGEEDSLGSNAAEILESLMHELTKRGKVNHIVVLDLKSARILAAVPSGMLSATDAIGMTKSIMCQSNIFKLKIGAHDYTCFKHRQNALQGRAPEVVMVMQKTETCVVAGFSRDDSPGSCNSEVNEFTKVLEEAGW